MVEDELFQGWLQRLAEASEMSYSLFCGQFIGQKSKKRLKYAVNLDEVVFTYHRFHRFFPDVYEVLEQHTTFLIDRMCMDVSMSARLLESILRNNAFVPANSSVNVYKTCPLCDQEDREKYLRPIIHVAHQIGGVKVCWKHGCSLTQDEIPDFGVEMKIAKFAEELYRNPIDCLFSDFDSLITRDSIADAVADGYLTRSDGKKILTALTVSSHDRYLGQFVRFLAWVSGGDVEALRNMVPAAAEGRCDDLFTRMRCEFGIGEYQCKTCGMVFHMSDRAVEKGSVCPYCGCRMTKEEQMDRILSRYRDGKYVMKDGLLVHSVCGCGKKPKELFYLQDYEDCWYCRRDGLEKWQSAFSDSQYEVLEVTDPDGDSRRKVLLRHRICGHEFEIPGYTKNKGNVDYIPCPWCDNTKSFIKRMRSLRVGERRTGVHGMGCEVIGYDGVANVTVRFNNGIVKTMSWESFDGIGKGTREEMKELYIGLEETMKNGRRMRIVEYRNRDRMKVADVETGRSVWTDMKRFQRRTVSVE